MLPLMDTLIRQTCMTILQVSYNFFNSFELQDKKLIY